jgi:hypothetical protein
MYSISLCPSHLEEGSVNRPLQVGKFSRKARCGKIGRRRRPISTARGNAQEESRGLSVLPSFLDSPFLYPVFAIVTSAKKIYLPSPPSTQTPPVYVLACMCRCTRATVLASQIPYAYRAYFVVYIYRYLSSTIWLVTTCYYSQPAVQCAYRDSFPSTLLTNMTLTSSYDTYRAVYSLPEPSYLPVTNRPFTFTARCGKRNRGSWCEGRGTEGTRCIWPGGGITW